MAISHLERGIFLSLFNRGGYVLDFSTNDFDNFTLMSLGLALCDHYRESKRTSDLLAMTEEGRLLVIETKGEQLKNDDSRDKLDLGAKRALASGPQLSYFRVLTTMHLRARAHMSLTSSRAKF